MSGAPAGYDSFADFDVTADGAIDAADAARIAAVRCKRIARGGSDGCNADEAVVQSGARNDRLLFWLRCADHGKQRE
jgi:hypothetical protein